MRCRPSPRSTVVVEITPYETPYLGLAHLRRAELHACSAPGGHAEESGSPGLAQTGRARPFGSTATIEDANDILDNTFTDIASAAVVLEGNRNSSRRRTRATACVTSERPIA